MLSVLKWTRRIIWFGIVILFLYLMVVGQYYIFFAYRNTIVTDVKSDDDKVTIIGDQFPNAPDNKAIHIIVALLFNVVIILFLILIIVSIINGTFEEYIKDRREYYD